MNGTPIPQRLPFSRNSFYIFPRNVNSFLCRIWYHSIGCILENSVLYSICTCRHLANHLVSQNLIFFNNYHKPFPSRAMSSFILLHMRILIVLSIFSNTWVHAWADTPLCSEPSLGTANGVLIKHEGCRTHSPKEVR